ncbi:uncharacterized protein LOC129309922 [Prosopis cineraria]|uniref:uncharacterized protein LOC129309922 n=1 Tax=Prosopis cineraria TaxID=364024 RepID=UPI00240EBA9F|nr:uncharacterized protein LOC129309922 [Prosopis cineraria]
MNSALYLFDEMRPFLCDVFGSLTCGSPLSTCPLCYGLQCWIIFLFCGHRIFHRDEELSPWLAHAFLFCDCWPCQSSDRVSEVLSLRLPISMMSFARVCAIAAPDFELYLVFN